MVALIKSLPENENDAPDVRPVGIGGVWRRAIVSTAVAQRRREIGESYEGIQVAVGVEDAAAKTLTLIRAILEANPDFVAVKIDLKNAYKSLVDPRLNYEQSLEMAMQLSKDFASKNI